MILGLVLVRFFGGDPGEVKLGGDPGGVTVSWAISSVLVALSS